MVSDGWAFERVPHQPEAPLNIYVQPNAQNRTLIIFVHGLGGSGTKTWGKLPEYIAADGSLGCDLATFDYTSGHRRLKNLRSTSLTDTARLLGAEIQQRRYETFVLVGHSMGGLIIRQAIMHLYMAEAPEFPSLHKIAGVVYCASPLAGSTRVPFWAPMFSADAAWLKAFSAQATDLTEFFNSKIDEMRDAPASSRRIAIPGFAAIATRDLWVRRHSAIGKFSTEQVGTFQAAHGSLVRPSDSNAPIVRWVVRTIKSLQRSQVGRRTDGSDGRVVTEFTSDDMRPDWDQAFQAATRAMMRTRQDIQFVDRRRAPDWVHTNLIVNVFSASSVLSGAYRERALNTHARQLENYRIDVGISAVGDITYEAVAQAVQQDLGSHPPGASRWVSAASDATALRHCFVDWLATICDRLDVAVPTDRKTLKYMLARESERAGELRWTSRYEIDE